jgi:hypothetical protein
MKKTAEARLFNNVNIDLAWKWRVYVETRDQIDSFNGPQAYRIRDHVLRSKNQHFYSNLKTARPQVRNPFSLTDDLAKRIESDRRLDAEVLAQMPRSNQSQHGARS